MTTTFTNRSTDMNLMPEELARAQMAARLGEAQHQRLARAARLSRKAEAMAQQARLALARAL